MGVIREASSAVHGQAVVDRLAQISTKLEPYLDQEDSEWDTATGWRDRSLEASAFQAMLQRAGIPITKEELVSLARLYGSANGAINLGMFRSAGRKS